MAEDKVYNVLFLCTENSARSIMAECLLNRMGQGRFKAYSAGSMPKGEVHPYALQVLKNDNYNINDLRSKSWNEFSGVDVPILDFVFTVCDDLANEICPVWTGAPMSAHWGVPDPSKVKGSPAEEHLAYAETLRYLNNRVSVFINLPLQMIDRLALQQRLDEIGMDRAKTPI